jgi:formyltetrahydrofolate deformylase
VTTSTIEPLGDFVLTLSCADRPGIVHAVATFLMEHGGNIRESQQFGDQEHGRFFMRIDFETARSTDAEALREELEAFVVRRRAELGD